MMKYVYGKDLPCGTLVYYRKRSSGTPFSHITRSYISHDATLTHEIFNIYCYFFSDGIWATQFVMDDWRNHVHLHPHCTLFDTLYSNLKAKNYF